MTAQPIEAVAGKAEPREVLARCIRALEAWRDGDMLLAEQLLDDLVHDLWVKIEALEQRGREAA